MAVEADAALIARHRARMFREMGVLPEDLLDDLVSATQRELPALIASGSYLGWLALDDGDPARVVAGVGLLIRPVLPRPLERGAGTALVAREGIVLNAYTEPEHRRRGLARGLMESLLAWTQANDLPRVVLHASVFGRPLYEQLGFTPGNEMRFAGGTPPRG